MEIKESENIATYTRGVDVDLQKEYEDHVYTEEELNKIDAMKTKMNVYFKISRDWDNAMEFYGSVYSYLNDGLTYIDGKGYIRASEMNDVVKIWCYGDNDEEAFVNMVRCYEYMTAYYETVLDDLSDKKLNRLYDERFPESNSINHKEHHNFFAAESVLANFRKYYGCNLPTPLIKHYEEKVSTNENENFEYSYKDKGFVIKKKTSLF